jgi:hypothetical protein
MMTPVISGTWEQERSRIMVQGQPKQKKVSETLSQKASQACVLAMLEEEVEESWSKACDPFWRKH